MAPPKRVLAEVAVGIALRYAPKAVPPGLEDRPLSLGSVAVSAVVADVGFFVVDAPVVIGLFEEPVSAEVVGIDLASGLYVPNRLWRHMENFSTNAVALVLSSTLFSEDDYIRDYDDFISFISE